MKYDVVISINVHEKPEYLMKQIENINTFIPLNIKIILNCNDYMFEQLKHTQLQNVVIYPESLNKRTFHGSLTEGIYRNMKYAVENYDFDYFLVMSSRDFFYRILNNSSQILEHYVTERSDEPIRLNHWHWPTFRNSLIFKYIQKNNMIFGHSMHEGLCLKKATCLYIIEFLSDKPEIMNDIFNFNWCIEEFALQTIACNHEGFYYLGNGCQTLSLEEVNPHKFIHKRVR